MQIVPQSDQLRIEAQLNSLDIKNITIGQVAHVILLPYNQSSSPKIEGKVVQISADSFLDEKTQRSYYKVFVEVAAKDVYKYPNVKLYPGMPVEAMIVNDHGTFLEYLIRPIVNSLRKAFNEA